MLIITTKERGKEEGETDADFWSEYLEEESEFFADELPSEKKTGLGKLFKGGKK